MKKVYTDNVAIAGSFIFLLPGAALLYVGISTPDKNQNLYALGGAALLAFGLFTIGLASKTSGRCGRTIRNGEKGSVLRVAGLGSGVLTLAFALNRPAIPSAVHPSRRSFGEAPATACASQPGRLFMRGAFLRSQIQPAIR